MLLTVVSNGGESHGFNRAIEDADRAAVLLPFQNERITFVGIRNITFTAFPWVFIKRMEV